MGRVLGVAGACAVQNSPPGSALLALHARVDGVSRDAMDRLLGQEKSLLQTCSMRGAPFLFPSLDAPDFTTGVLPATRSARLHLVAGVEPALQKLGLGLDQTVELAAAQLGQVLSGRRPAIGELGKQLAERVADGLRPDQRAAWREVGSYAANRPLGEVVMHFCVRILTLRGLLCMAPRSRNTAPSVLLAEWLGHALPLRDPQGGRPELLRRYLHCYGPSTRKDFAAWLGVRAADVDAWWSPRSDDLAPVEVDGRRWWLLAGDLAALRSLERPGGVRLLPPGDPYLQARDRDTLVTGAHQREVWRAVGSPATVLADGRIIGTWRSRTLAGGLTLAVRAFEPLTSRLQALWARKPRASQHCGAQRRCGWTLRRPSLEASGGGYASVRVSALTRAPARTTAEMGDRSGAVGHHGDVTESMSEVLAEVDLRRGRAVQMLDQVTDSLGVCAITKSGRSFPAAKVHEGAVAALGEVRRALLSAHQSPAVVIASVRQQWESRAREGAARRGPDWAAYHAGGGDALTSLEESLGV